MSASERALWACPDCDLLHEPVDLGEDAVAKCRRCQGRLHTTHAAARDRALALLSASLILLICANAFPFLAMSIGGVQRESYLVTGVFELYREGHWFMALAVATACIGAPALRVVGLLLVLAPRRASFRIWAWIEELKPWAMLDVFMLGVLVALVKLIALADVSFRPGFFAYVALVIIHTVTSLSVDRLRVCHSNELASPSK